MKKNMREYCFWRLRTSEKTFNRVTKIWNHCVSMSISSTREIFFFQIYFNYSWMLVRQEWNLFNDHRIATHSFNEISISRQFIWKLWKVAILGLCSVEIIILFGKHCVNLHKKKTISFMSHGFCEPSNYVFGWINEILSTRFVCFLFFSFIHIYRLCI